MKSKILIALLLTLTVVDATIVPALAQAGRGTVLTRTFGRLARVAEAETDIAVAVRFGRIPRRIITPIFNSAARTSLTRGSIVSAVRSNAIRSEFSATVGSLSKTSRTLRELSILPKLGS